MQTLVLAGDWVLLLASWELIGLSSYLLIGFLPGETAVAAVGPHAPFCTPARPTSGSTWRIFVLVAQTGTSEISADPRSRAAPRPPWRASCSSWPRRASPPRRPSTAGSRTRWSDPPRLGPPALGHARRRRRDPDDPGISPAAARSAPGGRSPRRSHRPGRRLVALSQRDLKRLLAASTSSQYGFMLLALSARARPSPRSGPPRRPRGDKELPVPRLRRLPASARLHGVRRTGRSRPRPQVDLPRLRRRGPRARRRPAPLRVLL